MDDFPCGTWYPTQNSEQFQAIMIPSLNYIDLRAILYISIFISLLLVLRPIEI